MTPVRSIASRADRPIKPWWLRAVGLACLSTVLAVITWWQMIAAYPLTQSGDGEYFQRLIESGKASILRYHELPLWNPYECGGVPLWDNPQSIVAAPLILLATPLNSTHTVWLWFVAHAAMGFASMWILVRHEFSVSRLAALVASCLWAFGVGHSSQYAGGHDALAPFLFMPLALFLWRRAETSANMAVGLGLLFALMFQEGATYPIPLIALILAVETITRFYPPKRLLRILLAAVIAISVTLTVGANRLLPVVDQLTHHKRVIEMDTDSLAHVATLQEMFLMRHRPWYAHIVHQQYVWGEYISYVGGVVLALALLGVLFAGLARSRLWFLFLALVVFALMLGHASPYAPWSYLTSHVFPFQSMRVPARFRLILVLFIATYAALAVDRIPLFCKRWFGRESFARSVRAALVGFGLLGAGDVMSIASDVIGGRFTDRALANVVPSERLYFGGQGAVGLLDQPRQNRATLGCYDPWNFTAGAPIWQGDLPQARAIDDAVIVATANRTHNKFQISASATRAGRIRVNTPYDRGWRSNVGTVGELANQLVIDLPPGHHTITVWYWPKGLTLGFILSGGGLFVVTLFFLRGWLFRRLRRIPAP